MSPPSYPPSEGWTAAYTLRLPTKLATLPVTDDGAGTFTVTLPAGALSEITSQLEARLIGTVTGSGTYTGQRYTIYDEAITILPNPETTTLNAARSAAGIELEAVNTAILALTTSNISAYAIGGRSVTKNEIGTLYKRQAVLEARIRAEKGLGFRQRRVAFVNG